jgi:hypothetical protein
VFAVGGNHTSAKGSSVGTCPSPPPPAAAHRRRSSRFFDALQGRSLTREEQDIIDQRVALQRKMFAEYERRELRRKVAELQEICPGLAGAEAVAALELCGGREDDAADALVSDPAFLQRIKVSCGTCWVARPPPADDADDADAADAPPARQGRLRRVPAAASRRGAGTPGLVDAGVFCGAFRGNGFAGGAGAALSGRQPGVGEDAGAPAPGAGAGVIRRTSQGAAARPPGPERETLDTDPVLIECSAPGALERAPVRRPRRARTHVPARDAAAQSSEWLATASDLDALDDAEAIAWLRRLHGDEAAAALVHMGAEAPERAAALRELLDGIVRDGDGVEGGHQAGDEDPDFEPSRQSRKVIEVHDRRGSVADDARRLNSGSPPPPR